MSKSQHTPTPWIATQPKPDSNGVEQAIIIENKIQSTQIVEMCQGNRDEELADASRIVACVNACEGINPEAVPGMFDAAQKAFDIFEQEYLGGVYSTDHPCALLKAALAKAKKGQS